ncbi:unnamed protein product [Sympodiomycopsis kandeliae]
MKDSIQSDDSLEVVRFDRFPTYEEFLHKVLLPNKPCLICPELIEHWPIAQWLQMAKDDNGVGPSETRSASENDNVLQPAFDLLRQEFGDHQVPVVITDSNQEGPRNRGYGDDDENSSTIRKEVTLSEAIDMMHSETRLRARGDGEYRLVYIKDWHLARQERLNGKMTSNKWYDTPPLFQDDWMNNDDDENLSGEIPDDFRFCYAGMSGTKTNLHKDVYGSYSWSTNLIGCKTWRIYDYKDAEFLLHYTESSLLSSSDDLKFQRLKSIEVVQEQGWTIFVPSNSFHTVFNTADTISINQNWCNSICLKSIYTGLKVDMHKTEVALDDVKDMMRQGQTGAWEGEYWDTVQMVNKSNTGWNWSIFWKMVSNWLDKPSCGPHFHPSLETFIVPLIDGLISDFVRLPYYQWLDRELYSVVDHCRNRCRTVCNQSA